jgi:hypothetical protein
MSPASLGSRAGGLLLETLISLTIGVFVLGAFVGVMTSTLRWSRALSGRSEALEFVRTVWGVLDEELRPGMVGRDWDPVTGTSLRLRAFRGVGRVCLPAGDSEGWIVAFRGRRFPEAVRDSLLVLGEDGGWRAFSLLTVARAGGCATGSGEEVFRMGWSEPSEEIRPILVRLFESGEYHLADGALRYRRGGGGRQPLTPERLGLGSGFRALPNGVEVQIEFPGNPSAGDIPPFVWPVLGRHVDGDL